MFTAEGQVVLDGIDYSELDTDGRLRWTIGFFGSPPPLDAAP
jgi:hypothetical protein